MKNLEGLIEVLGTACFHQRLYGMLDEALHVDHLSLLRFNGRRCTRLVGHASRAHWHFPQQAQSAYLERFHALDPNAGVFDPTPASKAAPARVLVRRLQRDQVPGRDYQQHCYDAAQLVDRLSVLSLDDRGGYALNLYRNRDRGAFCDGEMDRVHALSTLLAACCTRHADWLARSTPEGPRGACLDELAQRLLRTGAALSAREQAVAARVLAGMTSDGIAVDLDIGVQSVLTYRKRAYAKLGVNNQRELLARVLALS